MPGMVYKWRSGARLPVDAQVAGEAIEALRVRAGGQLSPAQVVDAARSEGSPLHPAFEWDNTVAAARHREDQARHLIGALVVVVTPAGEPREMRAFVSVTQNHVTGYTALQTAMSDRKLRQQVVERALRELAQWRERYEGYVELAAVHDAIGAAVAGREEG